tara:strand:+ start:43 stop:318 length:276 start_codon:yes stop_codon:yes gene_type:complete
MVIHLKKTQTLDFDMEERFGNLLDGDKAIQLAQVMADAGKDFLEEDDSPAGTAFRHYQNFYSATNPTLFDDLVNISADDAKQIVLKLLLKK